MGMNSLCCNDGKGIKKPAKITWMICYDISYKISIYDFFFNVVKKGGNDNVNFIADSLQVQ